MADHHPEHDGGHGAGRRDDRTDRDGSNGPNVLAESGIVRSDLTTSFGASSGVAEEIPVTVVLAIRDTAGGCAAMPGAAVYAWHCDRAGDYSLYSSGVTDQNSCRGVRGVLGPGDLAARAAAGHLRPGLRDLWLRAERDEPVAADPPERQRLR